MSSTTLKEYLEKHCDLAQVPAEHIADVILEDPEYIRYNPIRPMMLAIANTGFVLWINMYSLRLMAPAGATSSKHWAYSKHPALFYKSIKTHEDIVKYINTTMLELEL